MEDEEEEDEDQPIYRIDISLSYAKYRNEMGRPYYHFKPFGPMALVERPPDISAMQKFIKMIPEPVATQTETAYSKHELVTDKTPYKTTSMLHTSGGWPKEINDLDNDAVQRWRKKMMKNDSLNSVLPKFYELTERCLIQNNAINIYENYFLPPEWESPECFSPMEISLLNNYTDKCQSNVRPVQQLTIEPSDGVHVAGAYAHLTYSRRDFSVESECYIWDITRLPEPIRALEPTFPAVKLQYNSRLPRLILGGLITGQLCYWDVRAGNRPVAFSGLYETFNDPPTGCLWLQSKSGYDCFASSSDGQVIWYDIRKFNEPTDYLVVDLKQETEEPSLLNSTGISALEFEPTIPTKYMVTLISAGSNVMVTTYKVLKRGRSLSVLASATLPNLLSYVTTAQSESNGKRQPLSFQEHSAGLMMMASYWLGTETGKVIIGNRKGKTLSEKLSEPFPAFPSPVRALSRNPSYLKCFLCIGDFNFRVIAEDCRESYIFWSDAHESWLTGGKWSDLKNSVFFITRMDGTLDVWDLMVNVDQPTLSEKISDKPLRCIEVHKNGRLVIVGGDSGISDKPLRCIEVHKNGRLVIVGGDSGVITLLEVSSHFYTQDKNEKGLIAAMFDRETKREKLIDARIREVKLLQKQREMGSIISPGPNLKIVKEKIGKDFIKGLEEYDVKLMKKLKGEVEEEDYK